MKAPALLMALFLTGCRGAATQPDNGDIVLQLGGSATVAGLTITFRDVVEDSRCPRDVVCIWEGNARVQLDLAQAGGPEISVLLNTTQPSAVVFGARRVELVDLTPHPDTRARLPKSDYQVRLRATFLPD
jgi:hypothetical protein